MKTAAVSAHPGTSETSRTRMKRREREWRSGEQQESKSQKRRGMKAKARNVGRLKKPATRMTESGKAPEEGLASSGGEPGGGGNLEYR